MYKKVLLLCVTVLFSIQSCLSSASALNRPIDSSVKGKPFQEGQLIRALRKLPPELQCLTLDYEMPLVKQQIISTVYKKASKAMVYCPDNVLSAIYSPDGETLAAMMLSGNSILIMNARTGKEKRTLHCPMQGKLNFSEDGSLLATMTNEEVIIWNVETGEQLRRIPGDWNKSAYVTFTNQMIAVARCTQAGSVDHTVVDAWDIGSGQKKRIFHTETSGFLTGYPIVSSNGKWLGVTRVRIDPENGIQRESVTVAVYPINTDIHFMHDEEGIAPSSGVSSKETPVQSITYSRGEFDYMTYTGSLWLAPDGNSIVVAYSKTVRVFDLRTGKIKWQIYLGKNPLLTCGAMSPDGKMLALGITYDPDAWLPWQLKKAVEIVDVTTGRKLTTLYPKQGMTRLMFSPNSRNLVSTTNSKKTVESWHLFSKKDQQALKLLLPRMNRHIAPAPAQKLLLYLLSVKPQEESISLENMTKKLQLKYKKCGIPELLNFQESFKDLPGELQEWLRENYNVQD